jgi:hypothetical protein
MMGALDELDRLSEMASLADGSLLWIVTLNRAAWNYINCARGHRIALKELVELPPWSPQLIGRLIELRCRAADIDPDFSQLRLPSLLVEDEFQTITERNRSGVYRLVQDIAQGSPADAIRIWVDSLSIAPDGTVSVRIPDLPEPSGLETASVHQLLVLRVILQCDLATSEEISNSLRLSLAEVWSAVRPLIEEGWIESPTDHLRITDSGYSTVVLALNRRNLIKTSAGIGVL